MIDVQNDFINGLLGTTEAVTIVETVRERIPFYSLGDVIATMDTHSEDYLETLEGWQSTCGALR